jgi:hypothetical protein
MVVSRSSVFCTKGWIFPIEFDSCTSPALGMGARYPAAAVRQGRYRVQPGGNRNAQKKAPRKVLYFLIGNIGIFQFFVVDGIVA